MLFAQPPNGTAYPQTTKARCLFDIGAIVEGAITGKDSSRSKNGGYVLKGCAFVGEEMDRVTEENSISIVDECGEIDGFSLEEVDFRPYLHHTFLRVS